MNELLSNVPLSTEQYLTGLAALLIWEALIGAQKLIPPKSTLGLVWHILATVARAVADLASKGGGAPPAALALCLLSLYGCSGCGAMLPTALAKLKSDELGCAAQATQAAMTRLTPLAVDALLSKDTDAETYAALDALAVDGTSALACALGHLLFDVLGGQAPASTPATVAAATDTTVYTVLAPDKPTKLLRRRIEGYLYRQQTHR